MVSPMAFVLLQHPGQTVAVLLDESLSVQIDRATGPGSGLSRVERAVVVENALKMVGCHRKIIYFNGSMG